MLTLEELRQRARAFVDEELLPLEDENEDNDGIPAERWWELRRKSVELGIASVGFPTEMGGGGLGQMGEVVLYEELMRVGAALASVVPFPTPILMAGTESQREKFLYPSIAGEKIQSFAITEDEAGSDARGIKTSAERVDGGWRINGVKRFAGNGDRADFIIVFAVTAPEADTDRVTSFLVETDTPGFRVLKRHKLMGLRGWHVAELAFEDCFVPDEHVLGDIGKGFELARDWLANGRIIVAAGCVGQSARLLEMSRQHALNRVQFDQPIAEFQAIQFMLADSLMDLTIARNLTYEAAESADRGDDRRVTHIKASMAKLFASEALARIADRAVQIHGATGFLAGNFVERTYRNARIDRIWDGTSEIQRGVLARAVLKHGPLAAGDPHERADARSRSHS
jgi:acyl-CoA dehydrogenase